MLSGCCGLFTQGWKNIKENPRTAAAAGGLAISIPANILLLSLYYEGVLFNDMNEYAAQAAIAGIQFAAAVFGALGGAVAQKAYSHCANNDEENIAINTPRMV